METSCIFVWCFYDWTLIVMQFFLFEVFVYRLYKKIRWWLAYFVSVNKYLYLCVNLFVKYNSVVFKFRIIIFKQLKWVTLLSRKFLTSILYYGLFISIDPEIWIVRQVTHSSQSSSTYSSLHHIPTPIGDTIVFLALDGWQPLGLLCGNH